MSSAIYAVALLVLVIGFTSEPLCDIIRALAEASYVRKYGLPPRDRDDQ